LERRGYAGGEVLPRSGLLEPPAAGDAPSAAFMFSTFTLGARLSGNVMPE